MLEDDDVALRLLHTADWHLGKRFPSFEERDRLTLSRARLEVIDRILGLADRYSVHAVLCAGDLFDEPSPEPTWWEGLAKCLSERRKDFPPVFLLPGNHDPLTPSSIWEPSHRFRKLLPPFVHVVDKDDFSYELQGQDAILHARPCRSQAGEEDLALRLPARDKGDQRIRVGMVHGQTFDIPGYETNFPIARDAAVQRGFDYLALGDTHAFREVELDAPVPTLYPGSPEPGTYAESEAGSVAVVFVPRRGPGRRARITREQVGVWRWRDELIRDMGALRRLRGEDLRTSVVRVRLELMVSLEERDELDRILLELRGTESMTGRAGILQIDRTGLSFERATRPGELPENLPEALRIAIRRLEERAAEPEEAEVARLALYHLRKLVLEHAATGAENGARRR